MKLPELKELPTQELVDMLTAERDALAAQVEQLKPLARRCLWGAVNWNDHNFEPLHKYCRKSAADAGVFTVDQANALLEQTPAQCLAERDADAMVSAGKYLLGLVTAPPSLHFASADALYKRANQLRQQVKP